MLSLKRRFGGCGHGFDGCNGPGALGVFSGFDGPRRFGGFRGFDRFSGFNEFDGFSGLGGYDG